MIQVLHGGNTLASYAGLQKFLDQYNDLSTTRLSGSVITLNAIKESIETPSFAGPRLVIIEDLSTVSSPQLLADLKKYFDSVPGSQEVVLYERRALPPESPILKLTPKIQEYPSPRGQSVFDWTDKVGSRRLKEALSGWDSLVQAGEDPDYLFLMVIRQFRLLILLKKEHRLKGVPEFVERKMSQQVALWTEGDLIRAYQKLLVIDRRNKTGEMNLNLSMAEFLADLV